MRARFYVLTHTLGKPEITVRAYTERGGELLAEALFYDLEQARAWRLK